MMTIYQSFSTKTVFYQQKINSKTLNLLFRIRNFIKYDNRIFEKSNTIDKHSQDEWEGIIIKTKNQRKSRWTINKYWVLVALQWISYQNLTHSIFWLPLMTRIHVRFSIFMYQTKWVYWTFIWLFSFWFLVPLDFFFSRDKIH